MKINKIILFIKIILINIHLNINIINGGKFIKLKIIIIIKILKFKFIKLI